jgi:hypothetical protein
MEPQYGKSGKEYRFGETSIKVDDEFIIATLLSVIITLSQKIERFDETVSANASAIYEEIIKQNS